MEKILKAIYTKELREEAVKLAIDEAMGSYLKGRELKPETTKIG